MLSTSASTQAVPSPTTSPSPSPTTSASADAVPSTSTSMDTIRDVVSSVIPASDVIESISPYPKCSRVRQRKRKCETAQVLTSSPCKIRLLERAEKAAKKTKIPDSLEKKKKKKKLTCREDKPRGRPKTTCTKDKPRNRPRAKNVTKCKPKQSKKKHQSKYDAKCLMCDELFSDSAPGEKWIECQLCKGWCHEDCTDGGTSAGFTCDFCR